MTRFASSLTALALFGLLITGCGQSKPEKPPANADSTPSLTPTPESGMGSIKKAPAVAETPVANSAKSDANGFPEAAYLGDGVVGLVVAHPRRITEWPLYALLRELGLLNDFEQQIAAFPLKPEMIERVTLVINQSYVDKTAAGVGFESAAKNPAPASEADQVRNNLKMIGQAFHFYLDDFDRFPRANGDAAGKQTGLSWRVHLLPLFGLLDLYEEFHLDEPWDSEHNKKLIGKMPQVFACPGVTDPGKTSIHVLVGEKTAFHGDTGTGLRDFTDGTSNSILAVVAGPETADIWTKPGGLEFDRAAPKKSLGKIDDSFLALYCDGLVSSIPADIEDQTLANLIEINDGQPIDFVRETTPRPQTPVPTVILTMAVAVDSKSIIESMPMATEEEFEGRKLHRNEMAAVCFVDDKTILFGPVDVVKQMITSGKTPKADLPPALANLQPAADLAIALDVKSQSALLDQAGMLIPLLGLVQQIHHISLQINVTGKPGDKLVEAIALTADERMAATLTQLAESSLRQVRKEMGDGALPGLNEDDASVIEMARTIIKSAAIKNDGERIEFAVPVPVGFDELPELVRPALKKAAEIAEENIKRNRLKMIAIAFHNYHDVYDKMPGAGRSATEKDGLSWRVHLLPLLDEASLYNKFNLDEPWDGPTNKPLIDQMPAIFRTDGVKDPGKTSLHVFTGPGAPFEKNQTPQLRSITDGPSNTILAVIAGPDKADVWTKPGGLDFDPEDPVKSLGTIGDSFLAVMFDGAVRQFKDLKPETLLHLIQSQDGQPID